MADVSRLLDTTIAGQIARKLDENDGTTDNKINASVWNKFVGDIGTGRSINEEISITDAMNSIITYAVRLAAKAGKTVDSLAAEWLSYVGGAPQGVQKPDEGEGSEGTGGTKKTPRGTGGKYSTSDIKVTVPVKYISSEAKAILEARKQGTKLHDSLKKGDTRGLTPENTAYAFTHDVNFGPNTRKQAETVFNNLVKRMINLGIFEVGRDYGTYGSFSKLSYKQQNHLLHSYRSRIVATENKIISEAQAEKDAFNKDRGKMQSQIDKANQLLVNIANNPKQAKIKRGTSSNGVRWAKAELKTGEWIQVKYDKNGDINEIAISHDTTYDKCTDGSVFDGAEICYTKEEANVSIEHNGFYDYDIDGRNYNFAKLKELAEAIFGKAQ